MPRVVGVGEGMLELVTKQDDCTLGFGGDVLNTAIHLARLGLNVAFFTALGTDPFSADLRRAWNAENVGTDLIVTDAERQPGLYAIRTDPDGERTFQYWRDASAARRMFELPGSAAAAHEAARADLLFFSLISLAILPPPGREALFALARRVRERGGRIAYDGNFRPRLWGSVEEARGVHLQAVVLTDIGFPTAADEHLLFGEDDADAVLARWEADGVQECAVKLGAAGCLISGGERIAPARIEHPVDTSGAGDAFNAGYLAARLRGAEPSDAARAGHALAGWVITRRGAIPARTADAPYQLV